MTVVRRAGLIVVAAVAVVVVAGCSGGVGIGVTVPRTWPVADPLQGPTPVGYWACLPDLDYQAMRISNRARQVTRCVVAERKGIELLPDGTGRGLRIYGESVAFGTSSVEEPPDNAFSIRGSNLLYARESELRWQFEMETLRIQTTNTYAWTVQSVSGDVLRFWRPGAPIGSRRLLYRIGSPEYGRLMEFLGCVAENDGRSLFEVVDCGDPYEVDAS